MFLMYVDESGDCGMINSPTRYVVLSGLVVHELRWQPYLDQIITLRQQFKQQHGLKLREEIHASAFINRPGVLMRIPLYNRLAILRQYTDQLAQMTDLNVINIVVDKQGKPVNYDVFEMAWKALIQRFENTLSRHNFVGPANPDERGMLFPDNTDNKKLIGLLRKMRRYNPIPNQAAMGLGYRNLQLSRIVEDPGFRDSAHSYYIQAADTIAYFLYQYLQPNAYIRKKAANNYFLRLDPILCKVASRNDPLGIVRL